MIGLGKLRDGLYYLDTDWSGGVSQCLVSHSTSIDQIYLWHRRLGHPPFTLLGKLFPKLFQGLNVNSLNCESCILAKSHRTTFPMKEVHFSTPFKLIHYDV